MKIIQIIWANNTMYGLNDQGSLFTLMYDVDSNKHYWKHVVSSSSVVW